MLAWDSCLWDRYRLFIKGCFTLLLGQSWRALVFREMCSPWFIEASKAADIKTGSCVTHVKEPSVPSSIFHVLPEDIWHDTGAHHWQEWLTFQPIMVESFLPSVVSSGLSITMSALVLVYWSGRAALWVAVSSPMSLSDFFFLFFSHPGGSLTALAYFCGYMHVGLDRVSAGNEDFSACTCYLSEPRKHTPWCTQGHMMYDGLPRTG